MAKKQPLKPAIQQAKQPNTTQRKKVSDAASFNISNKVLIPAIILFFIVLAMMYCKPLLNGMQLSTHDSNQYIAMNKESADFKNTTGSVSLWSSRMFGGMPAYMIGGLEFSKILNYVPILWIHKLLRLIPDPAMDIVFLLICAFIGFYVLTRRVLYSFLGAVAIGFCTANFVSLDAGHITKVITIAMFLPLFASTWLIFQKKYITGTILFLIFLYEIIAGAHIQIAYYSLILIGLFMLYAFIDNIIKNETKHAFTSAAIILGGFAIAGMMNFNNYFVNDFSKETTRGGDILNASKMNPSTDANGNKVETKNEEGVGFDYATNWSFGYEELGSLLVPNFVGGSSGASLDDESHVYSTLINKNVPPQQAAQFVQRMPLYWGSEPFVQGPIYLGAIIVFLFIFGLFAYKGNLKWWIVCGVVFSILISLGKNFEVFYRLLYNFVPMFNKFRAPTMILALTEVLMVTLGVLGLKDFFDDSVSTKEDRFKTLKFSSGIIGGLLIFFIVLGSVFSFQSKAEKGGKSSDDQFKEQLFQMTGDQTFANDIYGALKNDRASLMRTDAIRSFIFVGLAVLLLLAFATSKFKQSSVIVGALSVLILTDFWMVSKRYLNDNDFEDKSTVEANAFPETPADADIMAQNKDGARMVDFTGDIFNSASPAYFHKTIGGYNPAKLRRYQDVIEHGLSYDFQLINKTGFVNANFINMLNTKYLKQSTEANGVIKNPYALGNAWFINNIQTVTTPEEEILKVRDINPAQTAIANKEFDAYLNDVKLNSDSSAQNPSRYITAVDTKNPMKLEYNFKSPADEFVVFSEVIYRPNQDWISYIDGKPADHIRVNYILRGMKVKEGEHKITFEFKPKLYTMTNNVLLLGNALFYLVIGVLLFLFIRNRRQPVQEQVV